MNTDAMALMANARMRNFINRSAGQHLRALRESYADPLDNSADQIDRDKAQIIRDVICELCSLGASKKLTDTVMAQLCSIAGVSQELVTAD